MLSKMVRGACLLALVAVAPASATVLNAGDSKAIDQANYSTTGATIVASSTLNYNFTQAGPTRAGTLRQQVVRLADGKLDIMYQFTQTGGPGLSAFTLNAFKSVFTDVTQAEFVTGPGVTFGQGKTTVATATRSGGIGESIQFDLSQAIGGGKSPVYTVIVHTNSTAFDTSGSLTLPGFSGVQVFGVYSALPIPEPTTVVLWGGAFVGLSAYGAWRRRRKPAADELLDD